MKKIDAVIRPLHWEEARAELDALGVAATLREVRTFGRGPFRREVYRGSAYSLDTAAELELSMLVQDEMVDATLAALEKATDDAEIVVTAVERTVSSKHTKAARPVMMLRASIQERPIALPTVMSTARG